MQRVLPGTAIEVSKYEHSLVEKMLDNMFVGGGVVLSQVCAMTGLEGHIVQNWVKRGFLSPPQKRMYSRRQLCRIIIINMLKDSMQLDKIKALLSYVNGKLNKEEDDIIDDSVMYNLYVNLLAELDGSAFTHSLLVGSVSKALEDGIFKTKNDRTRVERALTIMAYAYYAAEYQKTSSRLLRELKI